MNLKLVDKRREVSGVYSFVFKNDEPFKWRAGQFLMYFLDHANADERGRRRYFTIASAPFENVIILTTRFINEGGSSFKKALLDMPLDSTIYAEGPRGSFVVDDSDQSYVFIAGGIGITPFRSILLELDHKKLPINVILLYASGTRDFVYKKELEQLAKKHPSLKIQYIIFPDRIDESAIKKNVGDLQKPFCYISGPKPMVQEFENLLPKMGMPQEHLKRDYFPGYDRYI
ncbi:hypothetical protein A2165_03165 [Candidatus Curtissbacteria bacterium RBG_13_40_7]|uniref:FAD-binding FR-type domain-containing protein n=1 Tax=Candidatus Curtissbacteria bacterium RBG_13_40_7 TaxID=1797706 RepID=A0A1F5FYQ0_9BACT|nr:MAG: hypothetical protein A2165_03165 [Candidatus Curtissbacteria bacterium RBG_13_40_7]